MMALSALEAEQSPISALLMISMTQQEREELAKLVVCLNNASTAYGMEISAEKTKLMTNTTSGINTEIKVNGQNLESQVSSTWAQL